MLSAFFLRQGPSLCEKRQGEKKHDGRRGRKKKKEITCHVFYQTLKLRERVFFFCFFFKKAFGRLPKRPFYKNRKSKCWQPTARRGGWGQKFHRDSLFESHSVVRCTFAFLSTTAHKAGFEKKKNIYIYMSFLGRG